ncbi:MAG TPA: 50S ribosomal protein L9 [Planctomycetes bacterium]|nr:50S ribosomal protein L9 [Planctomycetota bacterium]
MSKKASDMQVLLMQDVKNLGKTGETVRVRPGYARNYLLPMGIAAVPDASTLAALAAREKKMAEMEAAREESLKDLAERIPQTNITLEMKVGPDGKLYGSVTNQMIADAMKEAGLEILASNVRLEEHIKEVGQFEVPIHVYGDVTVQARIWVVKAAD